MPVKRIKAMKSDQKIGLLKLMNNCFPTNSLNGLRLSSTITNAITAAKKEMMTLSPIKWRTSDFLVAPTTFLIPTSFALFSLRAVLRFMKLIQAINKMKPAITPNNLTVTILPATNFPFSPFE